MACTDHEEAKSSSEAFHKAAENVRTWEAKAELGHDLLLGECKTCRSSITIPVVES